MRVATLVGPDDDVVAAVEVIAEKGSLRPVQPGPIVDAAISAEHSMRQTNRRRGLADAPESLPPDDRSAAVAESALTASA